MTSSSKFYEQYSSGNNAPAGTASAFNTRALNTTSVNGLGLSLDTLTGLVKNVPAGTYKLSAKAKQSMYCTGQLVIWDYTNNVPLVIGLSDHTPAGGPVAQCDLTVEASDTITLTSTIDIGLNHYVGAASVTTTPTPCLGIAAGSGLLENYAWLEIEQ